MSFFKRNLGWTLLAIFFIIVLTIILSSKSSSIDNNIREELVSSWEIIDRELTVSKTWELNILSELITEEIVESKEEKEDITKYNKKEDKIDIEIINKWLDNNKKEAYFRVNVGSLKLNNIYFNKTLAYLSSWDKLKQISNKNSKGCFKIKVVSAINKNNIWKKWYVCEKYLRNDLKKEINRNNKKEDKKVKISKKYKKPSLVQKDIFYKINVGSLKLNNIYFNKTLAYLSSWDILRQITNKNNKWCFEVRIILSNKENNLWKQWYVCEKYLKRVELESTWLAF